MNKISIKFVFLIFVCCYNFIALAQVLTPAETIGDKKEAIFLSTNGIFPEGLGLFNNYIQYLKRINGRFDLILTYGNISALGQTQHYVGPGYHINLLRRNKTFFDVSHFNVITAPLNKRADSSTVLMTPAIMLSRPVSVKKFGFTPYFGFTATVPIGATRETIFTPPRRILAVPVGFAASLPKFKNWSVTAEVDFGKNFQAFGFGFLRVF